MRKKARNRNITDEREKTENMRFLYLILNKLYYACKKRTSFCGELIMMGFFKRINNI